MKQENTDMELSLPFPKHRPIDCITIGRANVDLYPPEGDMLNQARRYNVYVGGSPANIAAGISRLDLKAAIITRVAEDGHGHFVKSYLSEVFDIDTSQIQFDKSGAKTSLAFAECRKDADVIMYRNNVADLLLEPAQIDEGFIAKSKSVFLSGTSLTETPSRDAVMKVIEYAKAFGIVCVMDIDYRPYGWKSAEEASSVISDAASRCDIVIGTRDEFEVSGLTKKYSDRECANFFMEKQASVIVIKHGGTKPASCFFQHEWKVVEVIGEIFAVDEKKPYGAGDAFASCFLSMLIKKRPIKEAMTYAAANASINITGESCIEAMATEEDIREFLTRYDRDV